jgi:hypothetical protein
VTLVTLNAVSGLDGGRALTLNVHKYLTSADDLSRYTVWFRPLFSSF